MQSVGFRSALAATLLASLACVIPAQAAPFAYMTANNNDFGVLDLATGRFTKCGNPGVALTGLAAGPRGALYSAARNAGTIYTIEPSTGAATAIGDTGLSINDMGSAAKGVLYVFDNSARLYSVDPATGAATLLGPTGLTASGATSGISSGSSKLYLTLGNTLYVLSTKTGKAKAVGTGSTVFGGLVTAGHALYGGSDAGSFSVYTINPTTAADTLVAPLQGESTNFWGLAPTPAKATGACPAR